MVLGRMVTPPGPTEPTFSSGNETSTGVGKFLFHLSPDDINSHTTSLVNIKMTRWYQSPDAVTDNKSSELCRKHIIMQHRVTSHFVFQRI
jgi:hypothetical protein